MALKLETHVVLPLFRALKKKIVVHYYYYIIIVIFISAIMSLHHNIHLPVYQHGTTYVDAKDTTPYYKDAHSGIVLMAPGLFSNPGLNKLVKDNQLTQVGKEWATRNWSYLPFFDPQLRDSLQRPIPAPAITDEGMLRFVTLVQNLFGGLPSSAAHGRHHPFMGHIKRDMEREIIRRCINNGMKKQDGTDPTSKKEVMEIIKSLKGRFEDAIIFNYIYNWILSVTMESSVAWVQSSIANYLQQSGLPIALAPPESFPKKLLRHSLVRWAVKKGTGGGKDGVKDVVKQHFGKVLVLDEVVVKNPAPGTIQYQRLQDPLYMSVRFQDTTYVPVSRRDYPVYWVKTVPTNDLDEVGIALLHFGNGVAAVPNHSLESIIDMLRTVYHDKLHLSAASSPSSSASSPTTTSSSTTTMEHHSSAQESPNSTSSSSTSSTSTGATTTVTTTSARSEVSTQQESAPSTSPAITVSQRHETMGPRSSVGGQSENQTGTAGGNATHNVDDGGLSAFLSSIPTNQVIGDGGIAEQEDPNGDLNVEGQREDDAAGHIFNVEGGGDKGEGDENEEGTGDKVGDTVGEGTGDESGDDESDDEIVGSAIWGFIELVGVKQMKENPIICNEDGCTLQACSKWGSDEDEVFFTCLDHQDT